jgi:hypothetical protein
MTPVFFLPAAGKKDLTSLFCLLVILTGFAFTKMQTRSIWLIYSKDLSQSFSRHQELFENMSLPEEYDSWFKFCV